MQVEGVELDCLSPGWGGVGQGVGAGRVGGGGDGGPWPWGCGRIDRSTAGHGACRVLSVICMWPYHIILLHPDEVCLGAVMNTVSLRLKYLYLA